MLFRRREQPRFLERLRTKLWPTRTRGRSGRYVMFRLWRLRATPYAIAMGCAVGVFVAFSPFIGVHFITAAVLAWILRGNLIASAFGTLVGNPVTLPFIWFADYQLGNWLLGETMTNTSVDLSQGIFASSLDTLWPVLMPTTVGSIPLGLLAAAISYYPVKRAVEAYQEKRRRSTVTTGGQRAASA